MRLDELFTRHVGMAFERQLALSDYLGRHRWLAEPAAGTIDFFEKGKFPIQILGSESKLTGTWLWSWANEELVAGVPPSALRAAAKMRAFGRAYHIPALTEPEFDLKMADGHTLALIGSRICRADCYYCGPYEGGASFMLLNDTPLPGGPTAVLRLMTVISQVIDRWPVPHQAMIRAYLSGQGFGIAEQDRCWTAVAADGRRLAVTFDENGRLSQMNATVPQRKMR